MREGKSKRARGIKKCVHEIVTAILRWSIILVTYVVRTMNRFRVTNNTPYEIHQEGHGMGYIGYKVDNTGVKHGELEVSKVYDGRNIKEAYQHVCWGLKRLL